jgi:hypothetical protein
LMRKIEQFVFLSAKSEKVPGEPVGKIRIHATRKRCRSITVVIAEMSTSVMCR